MVIKHPLPNPNRLNTTIPHYSFSTYNIHSLSAHNPDSSSNRNRRYHKILANIKQCLTTSHIVAIQESMLSPYDNIALREALPHHHIYYNNKASNSGGTLIIILRSILNYYSIEQVFPHYDADLRTIKYTTTCPLPIATPMSDNPPTHSPESPTTDPVYGPPY